jgi:hypothetical protein
MTTMEVWPKERQTLKIFRNGLADGKGKGELGKERRVYVTGDGFRSQGPVERR